MSDDVNAVLDTILSKVVRKGGTYADIHWTLCRAHGSMARKTRAEALITRDRILDTAE